MNPLKSIGIAPCLLALLLASPLQAEETNLEQVTLQLKWTHAFQFAGYYMAQHNGYYREAGLDVDIVVGGPNIDVVGRVLSGEADFGVATSDLLLNYAEGSPVKVLGVVYQHSPVILIMRGDKPSATMQDLAGKTIMIEEHAADLFAMFNRAGVPLDQLTCLNHTGYIEDLLTSEAHAIFAYMGNEPFVLDQMGVEHFILSPRTYGIDFYGDNFFTTQAMLTEREDVAKGFRAASVRGWQAAYNHPEKAIDIILEHYPTRMSREHLLYEARITRDLMTGLVDPGYMLPGRWEHIADTYIEIGMLDKRPDLDGFIYQPDGTMLPAWFMKAVAGATALLAILLAITVYFRHLNAKLLTINKELSDAKEAAEQANRKKTWFIANVSHDLRAPISSIIGLTNIFHHHGKSLELPDKFNAFLEQLKSGGGFLMLMLNNILDLSAFEMNAAAVRPEHFELSEWGGEIGNLVQPLANEQGVQVRIDATTATIEADRTRLSQILLNLIHNAIKFTPENGTVRIALSCSPSSLEMRVSDEGPGIPEEERERIFDMFAQGAEGPSHRSGVGLGLSIVERNTRLLGGDIRIGNAQPTGTVFTVAVPLGADSSMISAHSQMDASSPPKIVS
ncbi:Autoinducer 2 sensor kinase/phosphatase LuxQ [Pontiella desulfatans]|uniref:histidine kinase n=1 Tax=Pontiella desulfatans TaxID=2750659 RepID=A0A6C2UDN0_PONDE|nr:ABC transporter substrate-binding protein [Pontiella desulfatans]VGO17484.1 Autoinducer 2 sensor kinase/phosphatase LuxQ [Pontiella desulfatans]